MNLFKAGSIELYDYQKLALVDLLSAFETRQAALMVMATGLGKTIVSAFFAKMQFLAGKRGLFLCHENDILDQAFDEYPQVLGGKAELKKFYGEDKDWDADKADILFASFQSFAEWHIVFSQNHFDYIIVDESHHGQAPTYKKVIQYFQPQKLLGMTATPNREDDQNIREIFGQEIVNLSLEEAIANSWLTPIEYHVLNDDINRVKLKQIVKEILEEGQRISIKQLNETIFVEARDQEIANQINSFSKGKKTIIFCENINHTENFCQFLPGARVYHSDENKRRNQQTLLDFRQGRLQYILTVNMFNEGIDIPDAEVIVFLRNTGSETIFMQQLGRGLRLFDGKKKVVVLDFVANCERLIMIKEIAGRIKRFIGGNFELNKEKMWVSGSDFDFIFSNEQIDILAMLNRLNAEFYATWQEASEVCKANNFKGYLDYRDRYKQIDPRLPSSPNFYYKDLGWPGWKEYLGFGLHYKTWQEALVICKKAGFTGYADYKKRCREVDPKLYCSPDVSYEDFPGWDDYLGIETYYKTWQKASAVAQNIGFTTIRRFRRECKQIDPKLHTLPDKYYSDFPGWETFLGIKLRDSNRAVLYATWREASEVCKRENFANPYDYVQRYKKVDKRLPYNPERIYPDFPGWDEYLGVTSFFKTWQDARDVCRKAGVTGVRDYNMRCKSIDSRLHSRPSAYYKDFPGFLEYFGCDVKQYYETWQEASVVCQQHHVLSVTDYAKRYKDIDPKLPSAPIGFYRNRGQTWPGWDTFLGKK